MTKNSDSKELSMVILPLPFSERKDQEFQQSLYSFRKTALLKERLMTVTYLPLMTKFQCNQKHFKSLAYFLVLPVSKLNLVLCEMLGRMMHVLSWMLRDHGFCSSWAPNSLSLPHFGS